MKKILATLLVATMLLSCLTFVGFAEDINVYTISNFGFTNFEFTENRGVRSYTDPFTSAYYSYVDSKITYDSGSATYPDSAYMTSLDTKLYGGEHTATSLTKNEFILVPIYAAGVSSATVYVTYDSTLVTPDISSQLKFNASAAGSIAVTDNGVKYNIATGALGDQTGYIGAVPFQVNAEAETADGTATAEFTLTFADDGKVANKAETLGTIGSVATMTASLTGLGIKEGGSDKTDITVEDLGSESAPIAAPASKLDASGFTTDAANNTVVSGDGADVTTADKYSCVFATITVGEDKNAPAAIGMVLIDAEGAATFYEAKNAVDGKFGIAFFGTETTLGLYKAAPAVKLSDGTLVYDADNAAAL